MDDRFDDEAVGLAPRTADEVPVDLQEIDRDVLG
jgi:hypothetical protein